VGRLVIGIRPGQECEEAEEERKPQKARTTFELGEAAPHLRAPEIWQPIQSVEGLNYDEVQSSNALI
jgi:hypothetical protein